MIEELEHLVEDISNLNSKLVLLIGPQQSGKSKLLAQLSERRNMPVLNVGAELGRKLLEIPSTRRHLQAADILKNIANEATRHDLLLIDNIELLFDHTLQLNPLDLLKRLAHARRVIGVWPGEIRKKRLSYAAKGDPEHRDYDIDGLVPFEIHW